MSAPIESGLFRGLTPTFGVLLCVSYPPQPFKKLADADKDRYQREKDSVEEED